MSLEEWAGAGCRRQEQRLFSLRKEGSVEGVPGNKGISQTVFYVISQKNYERNDFVEMAKRFI